MTPSDWKAGDDSRHFPVAPSKNTGQNQILAFLSLMSEKPATIESF